MSARMRKKTLITVLRTKFSCETPRFFLQLLCKRYGPHTLPGMINSCTWNVRADNPSYQLCQDIHVFTCMLSFDKPHRKCPDRSKCKPPFQTLGLAFVLVLFLGLGFLFLPLSGVQLREHFMTFVVSICRQK